MAKRARKQAARTAAPSLSKLQKTINANTRLRNQFLADPGAVLAKHGLTLDPDRAAELARFTQEVTAAKGTVGVGGISPRTVGSGARARVSVEVTVTVRF